MIIRKAWYRRAPGAQDPSPLQLKIRVVLTTPMTAEVARLLLHRAVETGIVPPGIEIRWLDWEKGPSGAVREGRIDTRLRRALREFYGAITASATRFEEVK